MSDLFDAVASPEFRSSSICIEALYVDDEFLGSAAAVHDGWRFVPAAGVVLDYLDPLTGAVFANRSDLADSLETLRRAGVRLANAQEALEYARKYGTPEDMEIAGTERDYAREDLKHAQTLPKATAVR